MENGLQALLSTQFILFALSVFFLTTVIRTLVELLLNSPKVPVYKDSKLWKGLLPILPILVGTILAACAYMYPYPEGIKDLMSRMVFGSAAGGLCTILFQVVKSMLTSKAPMLGTKEEPKDENSLDELTKNL